MNKLDVKERDTKNEKPRALRKQGIVPGILFGPNIENTPVQTTSKELNKAFDKDGEIYQVQAKSGEVFVKFDEVQRHPFNGKLQHFSLLQLTRGVKNDIEVPIEFVGEAAGVKEGGVFVTLKESVTIHGMIMNIPSKLTVDISEMTIGDNITVQKLIDSQKMEITDDPEDVLAICKPPVVETEPDLEETEPELVGGEAEKPEGETKPDNASAEKTEEKNTAKE